MPIKLLKENAGLLFIIKTLLVYGLWVVVRKSMKGVDLLYPAWVFINNALASVYVGVSEWILTSFFYPNQIKVHNRNILIEGTEGLYVGDHCLGISALFIFTLLILVLKGKWAYKLGYIFFGLAVIFGINLFRIVTLGIMLKNSSKAFFHFNHSVTYLVVVYGIIFAMIVFWEKQFSNRN